MSNQPSNLPKETPKAVPKSSQELVRWNWDSLKYRAAADVVDDVLTNAQIANRAQITTRQLTKWKNKHEFKLLIRGILGELEQSVSDEIVSTKAGRVRILIDMHNKLLAVIETRAEKFSVERVWAPGESQGVIVTKESWGKTNSQEASVDNATLKTILDLQERIAREMGQWEQNINVRHTGRVDHVHRIPEGLQRLSNEELEALEAIAFKVQESEHQVVR